MPLLLLTVCSNYRLRFSLWS